MNQLAKFHPLDTIIHALLMLRLHLNPALITLPRWYSGKEPVSTGYARDVGLIPGSGRSPGERNGNPLQYSALENPMDRGAWWATVHEVAQSRT